MAVPRSVLVLALGMAAACARPNAAAPAAPSVPARSAPTFGPHSIDLALREEWTRLGIAPTPRVDDATFLRRAYLDIAGTIPPFDVTAKFIADASPQKRASLVDALLASSEYAAHWTSYWDELLMGHEVRGNLVDRAAFREWLYARFTENAPWSRIVTELVSATGRNGGGLTKKRARQSALGTSMASAVADEPGEPTNEPINGAVNWALRFDQNREDLAGTSSRLFLGVQIQCAQCHDHKTESFKQDDFRRFASAFFRARVEPLDEPKMAGTIRRVTLVDSASPPPRASKKSEAAAVANAKPTAFDGTDLDRGSDTRRTLAAWLTSKERTAFARAFVNRMWAHYLGRGFVDPVDDMRPSNPARMAGVLSALAEDFAAHDFDIRRLVRMICASEAYQVSPGAAPPSDRENQLWSRFHVVPLGPEELLNSVFRATALERTAQQAGIDDMATLRAKIVKKAAFVFDTDEDNDELQYTGTIAQALSLLNGELVAKGSTALSGSMLDEVLRSTESDGAKIDALTLRVLGRHPMAEESARWTAYVAERRGAPRAALAPRAAGKGALGRLGSRGKRDPEAAAWEDVLWAMLNSSEFVFNH